MDNSVTWDDYGESHYISDINPNVQLQQASNYVDGFVHSNWRDVAHYYIHRFTSGTQPTLTVSAPPSFRLFKTQFVDVM